MPDCVPALVASLAPGGTISSRASATRGAVVAKTGTFGSVGACALAGVVETRRWGRVTFAVLNHDVPVLEARQRQDAFVRAIVADAGAVVVDYRPDPLPTVAAATLAVGQ